MHTPRKWKRSKESVCKWTQNRAGPFKTSKLTISDNFPINKSHQGPFQRLPTKFKKISDFAIFRVRKSYLETDANITTFQQMVPTLSRSLGHQWRAIKPKTASLYLSRNSRSNSGGSLNPPKCFQPKISKSPCIRLGNEKGQKKVSANEPKRRQDPSKHQNWPFQTTSQSTKVIRNPPRGFRPKKKKNSDLAIFRVRKSNFQSRLWFFGIFLDFQTQMDHVRKWLGPTFAPNN